jgi:CheY-like chemotaxis protein
VLVIDDDEDIRESLMGYLEDHGYRSLGAANGKSALELLADPSRRPCAIVLDLMMPIMDGRTFREEQLCLTFLAKIPVVLISAYANLIDVASDLGVSQYLAKPIDPRALIDIVRGLCQPQAAR